ncbi:MAG: ABC transporter ATP-binding protein [Polyangiaceae bacterium]
MTLSLSFEKVGKRYDQTVVLDGVDFKTQPGEFVVLVGPSGCGKSTLLRMVAGLETISEGVIRAGDRVLNEVAPQDRGVGMVFQSYALYPHMTVRENLAFPLYVKKAPADEQARAVRDVSEILGLGALLERYPKQLSGGQRQRVAIGRCLVRKPEIYCFDEPLSNLDAALRAQIRVELKALQRTLGKSTLYVTHDQVEAMTLADRIVVLNRGIVQQVGSPKALYTRPANRFVAQFIGTPSMSLIRGSVQGGQFRSGVLQVPLPMPDGDVVVGARVEDVVVTSEADGLPTGSDPVRDFEAQVAAVEPVGETGYLHLDVDGIDLEGDDTRGAATAGDLGERKAARRYLVASIPGHAAFQYEAGQRVRVRLRAERCHAFDASSGRAIELGGVEEDG